MMRWLRLVRLLVRFALSFLCSTRLLFFLVLPCCCTFLPVSSLELPKSCPTSAAIFCICGSVLNLFGIPVIFLYLCSSVCRSFLLFFLLLLLSKILYSPTRTTVVNRDCPRLFGLSISTSKYWKMITLSQLMEDVFGCLHLRLSKCFQ